MYVCGHIWCEDLFWNLHAHIGSYQTCGGGNEAGLANSTQATILVWHGMASLWGEWNMTLRLKRVLISALGCFQAGRRLTLRSRPGWSGWDQGCPNAKMGVVAMSIWIHSLRAIFLGFQNRISGPRKNHIYPSKGSEQLQIRIDGEERDIFVAQSLLVFAYLASDRSFYEIDARPCPLVT